MNFIHYLFETSFCGAIILILYHLYKMKEVCLLMLILLFCFVGVFIISVITPFDSQPHHLVIYSLLCIPFLFTVVSGILAYINRFTGDNI